MGFQDAWRWCDSATTLLSTRVLHSAEEGNLLQARDLLRCSRGGRGGETVEVAERSITELELELE